VRVVAWIVIGVGALGAALACAAQADASVFYTVAPHDTLYSIARHFGVPVARLIDANGLRDPFRLHVGQVLTIPDSGPAARPSNSLLVEPSPVARGSTAMVIGSGAGERGYEPWGSSPSLGSLVVTTAPRTPAPAPPFADGTSYVVQPGDTLYHIARTHGLTVAELQAANGLAGSDTLHVGQALAIPGPGGTVGAPAGASALAPAPAAATAAVTAPTNAAPGTLYGTPPGSSQRVSTGDLAPAPAVRLRSTLLARQAVAGAMQYLGTPYVWGGTSRAGVDCSGLVYLVYSPFVPNLPRLSFDQWGAGIAVDRNDVAPGDLVFFDTDGSGASHVGIYIGDGRFVHASSSARRVVVDNLDEPYYLSHYLGARRVL